MRFSSIWLYTLLTIVSSGLYSHAVYASTSADCATGGAERRGSESENDCIARLSSSSSGASNANMCNKLRSDLAKEQSEMMSACGEVHIGSPSQCDKSYVTCISGDYEDAVEEDDSDDDAPSKNSKHEPINKEYMKACPSLALETAKQAKEELKDLKDAQKDIKEKIEQKKLDIAAAANEISDKNTQYEEDVANRGKDYKTAVKDTTKSGDDETEDLTNQITDATSKLSQAQSQTDAIMIEYIEQVAQIENVCSLEAEQELAKKRDDDMKKLGSSSLTQQNLGALLKLKVSGRNSADEAYRARAKARCQANPDRYKKPIQLLNNRYEQKKAAVIKAIADAKQAIVTLQNKLTTKNAKHAQDLQELATEYQSDLTRLQKSKEAAVGTCQMASPTIGGKAQTGAQKCTGLMDKQNLLQQSLQSLNEELTENKDDISYTQELFSAAKSATGNNTSGQKSAQTISEAAVDVLSALTMLQSNQCGMTSSPSADGTVTSEPSKDGKEWEARIELLRDGKSADQKSSKPASGSGPKAIVPTGGGSSGSAAKKPGSW